MIGDGGGEGGIVGVGVGVLYCLTYCIIVVNGNYGVSGGSSSG